jgi:hypothetical protein
MPMIYVLGLGASEKRASVRYFPAQSGETNLTWRANAMHAQKPMH